MNEAKRGATPPPCIQVGGATYISRVEAARRLGIDLRAVSRLARAAGVALHTFDRSLYVAERDLQQLEERKALRDSPDRIQIGGCKYISINALAEELGAYRLTLLAYDVKNHKLPPSRHVYVTADDAEKIRHWFLTPRGGAEVPEGYVRVRDLAERLGISWYSLRSRLEDAEVVPQRFFKAPSYYVSEAEAEKLMRMASEKRHKPDPYLRDARGCLYISLSEARRSLGLSRQRLSIIIKGFEAYRGAMGPNSMGKYLRKEDFCVIARKRDIDPETLPWDTAKLDEMSPREK
ncbi:hypothetical protein EI42_03142 [Thermosporothrix hazakensis]|jgi:transcriptional regulator with XRE-family HTH domain|uniref:Uncharacterized protein n=1 Tax=Thermosporothrix hazakensis TaxID=644383 RepID=A0A326U508_THEHA|nr:hypothetical protein [Thermosporothrix hazakensis]PZW28388.1 hypothetical protein EI42_03142 [Thermosporothrix hazakensis]GCE46248.1 hypothetical protein KTH_11170 [Thermosporothrix hazakensis]